MPVASAIGTKPSDATSAVISTGRSRVSAPSRIAWSSPAPSSRSERMNDSITSPFSTATPHSAIKPTAAEIDSGMPRSHSARMPPVSANGMPVKTSSPSLTLPNMANSSTNTIPSASGTTMRSRAVADCSCSKVPPQLVQ
ncbi:hypothetical protein D3C72_1564640 [compost metagenome]